MCLCEVCVCVCVCVFQRRPSFFFTFVPIAYFSFPHSAFGAEEPKILKYAAAAEDKHFFSNSSHLPLPLPLPLSPSLFSSASPALNGRGLFPKRVMLAYGAAMRGSSAVSKGSDRDGETKKIHSKAAFSSFFLLFFAAERVRHAP